MESAAVQFAVGRKSKRVIFCQGFTAKNARAKPGGVMDRLSCLVKLSVAVMFSMW